VVKATPNAMSSMVDRNGYARMGERGGVRAARLEYEYSLAAELDLA